MLRQRVITAIVLLLLLGVVLGSESALAFYLTLALFFGAACWEALRLFGVRRTIPLSVLATLVLILLVGRATDEWIPLASLCVLLWALRFAPSLRFGLPPTEGPRGALFTAVYLMALFGCFVSIAGLWQRSIIFMITAMAIVWVADIGAYFAGRAFGRRKLAPTISPGKSWEGVAGGMLAVLLLSAIAALTWPPSFPAQLLLRFGWPVWALLLCVMVVASVVGDLFESLMKRRAGMKDSSALLPGHGGVLDRMDALIPTMPFAYLLSTQIPASLV
jgi:phosphatidate cytidylyltransferase